MRVQRFERKCRTEIAAPQNSQGHYKVRGHAASMHMPLLQWGQSGHENLMTVV